ncbi:AraC family transcriptional regulator [Clostridium sp.]|uniref:helix-turn-helix domain-containing protein n=1 Tax=Clostridium sp. TaxID=1506 RepID=UPI002627B32F|nr:AraC family transcriptional regulator [Clostridium sp.]
MFYLNSVLETFNNCCKLPIALFDSDLYILNKNGYSDISEKIISHFNVVNDLKSKKREKIDFILTYSNNISFLFVPFLFNINKPLFFLIGPFSNSNLDNNYNIPKLSQTSFKYIKHLLYHLLNNISINSKNPFINRAIEYIHVNYSKNICIDTICKDLNINKCYFCNLFKKETGYTFIQFLTLWRVEKSKLYLQDSSLTLLDVSLNVGFNNQGYYSTIFKKATGQTPSQYRNLSYSQKSDKEKPYR